MNICPVCEESVSGEIGVFNYDWFILTEYNTAHRVYRLQGGD